MDFKEADENFSAEDKSLPYFEKFQNLYNFYKNKEDQFNDLEFPPNINSLVDDMKASRASIWKNLEWHRPKEIFKSDDYDVFQGNMKKEDNVFKSKMSAGIEPDDIKQGSLGDCYFLATLSSLAEWPPRIKKLFITKRKNKMGIYAVKLNYWGEWRVVIVDDNFPCNAYGGGPAFTRGNGNELWVLILEKAWAKLFGNYDRIEAGLAREALRDLTGAPTKVIFNDEPQLWDEILSGEKKNYIMTTGANEEDDLTKSTQERLGLVASHAYSLISANEINGSRLVRLRNPWGNREWRGSWSDESPNWTSDLKAKLNYHPENNDGTFFMSFDDFKKYFSDTQICMYSDSYKYNSIRFKSMLGKGAYFNMNLEMGGEYTITVNQESKRKYPEGSNYKYSSAKILVARMDGGSHYKFMGAKQKTDKEVWVNNNTFTPGQYIVYVKVDWFDKADHECVLSAYGAGNVKFNAIKKGDCPDLIDKCYAELAMSGPNKKSYEAKGVKGVERFYLLKEDEGFGALCVVNKGDKKFETDITLTSSQGIKLRKPFSGVNIKLAVDPGKLKLVTMTVNERGYSFSFSESFKV